ncbi:hypothetical protein [Streptomyces sp. sk2.1]|uniref:hypothetical protein n=1 Tax=Streptomyces sp. sk2.1 TaxID=2478959 RepID=UPI0011E790CE|nr:hypothetical protein [Streptomyces sp. sk2.1]TXS78645.1 hypothetical protein EAO76_09795 [Streptomyces sp. sk2.1]
MATEVLVERASLDDGVVMIFKEFGRRVRMAFDPRRISESRALALLCQYLPRLIGAMKVVHRADA